MSRNLFHEYQQHIRYLESLIDTQSTEKQLDQHKNAFQTHVGGSIPCWTESQQRMRHLLRSFDHPERAFKIIHLAGTSGKGSTATMIHSILNEFGITTGLYLSPHPTTTLERVKIGSQYVAVETFIDVIHQIRKKTNDWPRESQPRYLEFLLLTALLCFRQTQCEYVVLETSLGGTNDITNVCPSLIQIITNIGYDHRGQLGHTLQEIAQHKIGIIKHGGYVFTAEKKTEIIALIKEKCHRNGAVLVMLNESPIINTRNFHGSSFQYKGHQYNLHVPGEKQIENSLLALEVARFLGVPESIRVTGLENVKLPCRLETVQTSPQVILDAAHNRDEILQLTHLLNTTPPWKIHLIFASVMSLNTKEMLQEIVPMSQHLYLTRFDNKFKKCYSPQYLLKIAKSYIKPHTRLQTSENASVLLKNLLRSIKDDEIIVATGSYFLTGSLRQHWYQEEKIVNQRTSFQV